MIAEQKILVIDDEGDIGELITTVAREMGFQCDATHEPITFLEKLSPDTNLVLLDLIMPEMDGIELLRLLGKRKCKAGIILMSGLGVRTIESAEKFAQALGLFIVGHLQKPFRPIELVEILQKVPHIEPPSAILTNHQPSIQKEEFESALLHNEFVVYYQPQIDTLSGHVIGVEALVRWRHPQRGLIFPDGFIGRMEKLGLIDELGWVVANRAMREVGQFTNGSGKALSISLNASIDSLCNLDFPDTLASIAEQHGVSRENVTVEITETGLIKELSKTLDTLTRLRMKGVKISVDDFGSGYATMKQFKNIPATELKIDKSFVLEMISSERDRIMVQKTIELGHELGMHVIAEGVETPEQLYLLRSYGCDSLQGYLFTRPIPAMELVSWLKTYRAQLVDSHPHVRQLKLFESEDGHGETAASAVSMAQQNGFGPKGDFLGDFAVGRGSS
jgi:EAL domain-containing protein (putative c-di-GMP-specific phosphodiesterase class I)/CheY-like chemotaxis protein